jgi:hypothetical protein
MRKRFSNKSMTPPGGFTYIDKKTGVRFNHIVWAEIMNRIRLFKIANGHPLPPGWEAEVESEMCEGYEPPVWRFVEDTPQSAEPRRSIGVGDVLNFLKVLWSWTKDSQEFVPQEEAERRAAICRACPYNVPIDNCTVCAGLSQKVAKLLGNRATGHDGHLKACGVCGCSNAAQVHFPLEVLQRGITSGMVFPPHCWKPL